MISNWMFALWVALGVVVQAGCLSKSENEVVVYAALDREFSQPILHDLAAEMGVQVLAKYDVESNKTVGLVNELIQHAARPQADIFWNNEILHTLRLKRLGLLDTIEIPAARHFPANYRDAKGQWFGFAARARVLIVNTDLLPNARQRPNSIYDLADARWKGKCGLARPLFGTSATHAAVLFQQLGAEEAQQLFLRIAANASVEGGNKQVAIKVARGELAFGLTDTDDAMIELEHGQPVTIVFPDQLPDQMGTLLIPNTVCVIKKGPHSQQAKQIVARLLQPDVESRLATGASAQIPLSELVPENSRVEPDNLKLMSVDFENAANQWDDSQQVLLRLFPLGGASPVKP